MQAFSHTVGCQSLVFAHNTVSTHCDRHRTGVPITSYGGFATTTPRPTRPTPSRMSQPVSARLS
eukprot:2542901-Prymnesium_polylepis.1